MERRGLQDEHMHKRAGQRRGTADGLAGAWMMEAGDWGERQLEKSQGSKSQRASKAQGSGLHLF